MYDLKFSILIPAYNGANIISDTLRSILSQSFDNFEIIIQDDASKDDIKEVVESFKDSRIKFFANSKNLGYPGNLEECRKKANGDIIYLMGQDDILATDALLNTYKAFKLSEDIGAVTRPYFWFSDSISVPVRAKEQLDKDHDTIIGIDEGYDKIISVFKTLDQLSGLAYRTKYIDRPFHQDIFPSHVYPFASIFKKHPIVFLKDYNTAVRIATSQTRSLSSIYDKSPLHSWVDLFKDVFCEEEFSEMMEFCIKNFVAKNYVGLIQIRNYARYSYLLREIYYLIKFRPRNLLSPPFWFFSLGCMVMPSFLLISLVDFYKDKINSKRLRSIEFGYKL